ncbi:MAG: DUF5131 family protein [bacterium]
MSDLFHDLPLAYPRGSSRSWSRPVSTRSRCFTKRSGRLREVASALPWPGNVWMGVSVESAEHGRVHDLQAVPAA